MCIRWFKQRRKGWGVLLRTVILILLPVWLLSGCSQAGQRQKEAEDERLYVVTTVFPYYDFVRQIAGDKVRLKLVVPAGMDSHSFEPTPADVIAIQEADILIRNGGAMEHWLDDVLGALDTSEMTIVTMMDYVDTVEEEIVEGMEAENHSHGEEDHSHEEETDGHELEIEYDEHIWTSPVNAKTLVGVICGTLTEADPDHGTAYQEHTAHYQEQLTELDQAFRDVTDQGKRKIMVVADKFPFRYFADEYGLDYRAAFTGCSSDTEPSAQTIAYLIDKVREEEIPAVYYLELSTPRVAEIIQEETGAKPMLFHSCHNVTRREFDEGVTYLQLMENNVKALRAGLN